MNHRKVEDPYDAGGFLTMSSLRTLQIRTAPTSYYRSRGNLLTHWTKAMADDFIDYALGNDDSPRSPRSSCHLMALVIGSLSFRQHWRLQHESTNNDQAPHFRAEYVTDRPMVFGVTFSTGCFGTRVHTLEQFEFETVRDLDGFIPTECLESIWLENSSGQYGV